MIDLWMHAATNYGFVGLFAPWLIPCTLALVWFSVSRQDSAYLNLGRLAAVALWFALLTTIYLNDAVHHAA
jgi:hypothetical protein